jgi:hypothetical protein
MKSGRKFRLASLILAMLMPIVLAACGVTPEPTAAPAATEAPQPTETPPQVIVGYVEQEATLLEGQIAQFNRENPDIQALSRPYGGIDALMAALASGEVDVVAFPYNQIAVLQLMNVLMPLDDWFSDGDYLTDALESITFDSSLYGLPWQRSACLPHYNYLAMGAGTSAPEAAFRLMDFLTASEQQAQNYDKLLWYPTRVSLYGSLGLDDCLTSPIQAIRLEPAEVEAAIGRAETSWQNLAEVLEGETINPQGAVAVIENGEHQGTGAPRMDPISSAEFEAQIDNGVVVGMLIVEYAPEYPPGEYAVKWQRVDGEIKPYLVKPGDPEPTVIETSFERFEATAVPIGQPFFEVETGSFRACGCLDGLCGCIKVG